MTNPTDYSNYSYDTIPGTVEEDADPGENNNTKKDENVNMKKKNKVGVSFYVLGLLCIAFLVVGRGHQYRPGGGTNAASSSIVSVLPFDPAETDRIAGCQQLCASRPVVYCHSRKQELLAGYNAGGGSDLFWLEYGLLLYCVEEEQVCVEQCSSSGASISCDDIRETTFALCMLWNCKEALLWDTQYDIDRCFEKERDDCLADADTVFAQQHCTNTPTVAPTPTPPPVPLPAGADCSSTAECAVPSGLTHGVCRDGQCQSGASGSSCGVDSDCVKPTGLDQPVCRQGKCQRGVYKDYCGQDSDCTSNNCVGVTDIAKCKK